MLMTDDFFRNRLNQLIDLRYPLAVLANRMPWQEIEALLDSVFINKVVRFSKQLSPRCQATPHSTSKRHA
jgi:hypothetical protein